MKTRIQVVKRASVRGKIGRPPSEWKRRSIYEIYVCWAGGSKRLEDVFTTRAEVEKTAREMASKVRKRGGTADLRLRPMRPEQAHEACNRMLDVSGEDWD
jgi:hypothetical protein